MKLSHLIEHHRKWEAKGLPGALGDGYLVTHNRVFRQIREAVLQLGFQISAKPHPAYEAFPLLQLEKLLSARELPFFQTQLGFQDLSDRQLAALDWEDLEGNLKKNYVFHEGTHAVARALTTELLGPLEAPTSSSTVEAFVLRMLIEESSANAAEALAVIDVKDQLHRCFFSLNSYMNSFEHRPLLIKALEDWNFAVASQLMLLAYLHANFLRASIVDSDFEKIVSLVIGPGRGEAKKLKSLRSLSRVAFQLNERFRVQTTGFHLRLAGVQAPLRETLKFDFMKRVSVSEPFKIYLQRWAQIFEKASP